MKQHLLIITDCIDVAANELYATISTVLDKLESDNVIIDPMVNISAFSIINGNFISRLIADSYDPHSLTILAIVNPLDTSKADRSRIAGRLKNGIRIVGANTGIFTWLIEDYGIDELYETDPTGLKGDSFIPFGGKYIHAPIAAKLAATNDFLSIRHEDFDQNRLLRIQLPQGLVLHIDNFGVIKIYYKADDLPAQFGDKLNLFIADKRLATAIFTASMKEQPTGTLCVYKGSSLGLLEIGSVRETNTADKLGINIGDVISISK